MIIRIDSTTRSPLYADSFIFQPVNTFKKYMVLPHSFDIVAIIFLLLLLLLWILKSELFVVGRQAEKHYIHHFIDCKYGKAREREQSVLNYY